MLALRLLPLVLSSLLLAAHFYRAGALIVAIAVAVAPLLLLVRRAWAVHLLQIALFVGAAEWIRTALTIGAMRAAMGQPSVRMFLILSGVALFTILSALPLRKLAVRSPGQA
ncbi:MAG TPA: hypothetical protein VF701_10280 [Thermoanaerobaculia bacterium]